MSSTLLSAIGTAVFFTAMCVALAYGYVAVERLYQADLAAHAELARPVRRPNLDATDVHATDVGGVDLRVTCVKFMGAGFTATAFTDGPEKVPAVERFRSAGIGLIQLGDPYEDAVLHPPPVVRPRLAGRPVSPAAARQPVARSVTGRNLRSWVWNVRPLPGARVKPTLKSPPGQLP